MYAIKILHLTGSSTMPFRRGNVGRWVLDADPDAMDGQGMVDFTILPSRAKKFASAAAAVEFWQTQSTVKPLREDGKPNCPLTAFTVEVISLD